MSQSEECLKLAKECEEKARSIGPHLSATYLHAAQLWRQMAKCLEKSPPIDQRGNKKA